MTAEPLRLRVTSAPTWQHAITTLVEQTQRDGRFRFVTFCTYDASTRTTRSFSNGGWHQPLMQRAFALMNLRLPDYDPLVVATPVDANPHLSRIVDDRADIHTSIEAYTDQLIPSLLAMLLGRVAGGKYVVGMPVTAGGEVVGILTGYQRRPHADAHQITTLRHATRSIAAVLERSGVHAFTHDPQRSRLRRPAVRAVSGPEHGSGWRSPTHVGQLSARQRDIWALIAQGHSNASIAQHLGVSPRWIENAVGQVYAALGIDTRDVAINARVQAALLYRDRVNGASSPDS